MHFSMHSHIIIRLNTLYILLHIYICTIIIPFPSCCQLQWHLKEEEEEWASYCLKWGFGVLPPVDRMRGVCLNSTTICEVYNWLRYWDEPKKWIESWLTGQLVVYNTVVYKNCLYILILIQIQYILL